MDKPFWVIGCIGHDGAIVGRPYAGRGCSTHTEAESRGKRWRWSIRDQGFMETLDMRRRAAGLSAIDGMTNEETLLVVDWLVKEGHATDETYSYFAKRLSVRD